MRRDAWPFRHLDDLLVVAFVAACFGASVVAIAAGVHVLTETIALGALLVVTLLIVQYARHGRRETVRVTIGSVEWARADATKDTVLAEITIPDPRA